MTFPPEYALGGKHHSSDWGYPCLTASPFSTLEGRLKPFLLQRPSGYVFPLAAPLAAAPTSTPPDRLPTAHAHARNASGVDSLVTFRESLRIGIMDGNPDLEFGRVGTLAVDGRGQIHVFDRLRRDIRVFDGEGALVRVIGRAGSGPRELSSDVQTMAFGPGDTLFVADPVVRREPVFGPDGEPLATRRTRGAGCGAPWPPSTMRSSTPTSPRSPSSAPGPSGPCWRTAPSPSGCRARSWTSP